MPRTKYEFPADRMFITPGLLRKRYGSFDPNVFTRWQRQGRVRKLRKDCYLNPEFELIGEGDYYKVANRLCTPSYISLHSALRYYNFIPETVYAFTSVTTRKTNSYGVGNLRFHFRHLKPELFFGYRVEQWKGVTFRVAQPEKCLLDFAYYHPDFSDPDWLEEMRFDADEMAEFIDWHRMESYLSVYASPQMDKRIATLRKVYEL